MHDQRLLAVEDVLREPAVVRQHKQEENLDGKHSRQCAPQVPPSKKVRASLEGQV